MLVKTSELTGVALDWAVAKAEGWEDYDKEDNAFYSMNGDCSCCRFLSDSAFNPSNSWAQAGLIIERENISLVRAEDDCLIDRNGYTTNRRISVWAAVAGEVHSLETQYDCYGESYINPIYEVDGDAMLGHTPLIAAMRCYVANKLGDAVDIPEELM